MSFFTEHIWIKVYKNEMEIIHLETGKSIRRKSKFPFTSDRQLVGNFKAAQEHGVMLIKELIQLSGFRKVFPPSLRVIIQAMEMHEGGLSQVEERGLRDLVELLGSKNTLVYDSEKKLNNKIALDILKKR